MKSLHYKCIILLIVFTVLFSAFNKKAQAESFMSGNPLTVNRESGFNALRNPALMSWAQQDILGIAYLYSIQNHVSGDINISPFGSNEEVDIDINDYINGVALVSYVMDFNRHALGLAIRNSDGRLFSASENDFNSSYYLGSSYYSSSSREKKKEYNVSSVFSYSYRISNRQSLGIQAETGYAYTSASSDKTTTTIIAVTTTNYESSDSKQQYYFASSAIGYSYIGKNIEAGIMLKSSEYTREQSQVKYQSTDGTIGSGDKEIDPYSFYKKGFEVNAGIGYRINFKTLLLLETGGMFPYEYETRRFSDKFVQNNNNVKLKENFSFKIGVDYHASSSLSIGIGAGGHYTRSEAKDDNLIPNVTTVTVKSFDLITGAEYRFTDNVNLILGCDVLYIEQDSSTDMPVVGLKMDMGMDIVYTNIVAGARLNF